MKLGRDCTIYYHERALLKATNKCGTGSLIATNTCKECNIIIVTITPVAEYILYSRINGAMVKGTEVQRYKGTPRVSHRCRHVMWVVTCTRYIGTWAQRYRGTEIQRYRDREVQRYRGSPCGTVILRYTWCL